MSDDIASSKKQAASFVAGGIAGSFSSIVTCPMDVVMTHLQASPGGSKVNVECRGPFEVASKIARVEGFRGFFRGLLPTLVAIIPARATFFWAYATTKSALIERYGENSAVHMSAAAAAGIMSDTVTNPIWLMRSRVQLQAGASPNNPRFYRGYRDAILRILREEGIGGFFKGVAASYWGVTESGIQFVLYERIKSQMMVVNRMRIAQGEFFKRPGAPPNPEHLSFMQYTQAAAASKLIASVPTYPLQVVRLRMHEKPQFVGALPKYRGIIQSLRVIALEEGPKGLYAGMGTHLVRVVPNTAIMFYTFEIFVNWIEKHQDAEG